MLENCFHRASVKRDHAAKKTGEMGFFGGKKRGDVATT